MKNALLAVLVLGFCFVFGYWTGNNPQAWEKIIGNKKKPMVWLFSDASLVPTKILQAYQKEVGEIIITVEAKTLPIFLTEVGKADLILSPKKWIPFERGFAQWGEDQISNLATEFQGKWTEGGIFFPVFWKSSEFELDQVEIEILGLVAHESQSEKIRSFLKFTMDQPHLLKEWTTDVQLRSTLKSSETWENFPQEMKPSHLRQIPFRKIK